jgi:F1F0 ATPase subunit 2
MLVSSLMITLAAFGIGLLLSGIHFGGLWLTVRLLPSCERPRLFFWSSYLARYAVTLYGVAQVMKHGGLAMTAAFIGFYLLRTFMLSRVSGVDISEMNAYDYK